MNPTYYTGTTRMAMRTSTGGLQFILGDHLGSSSVLADARGALLSSQGYMLWGETRFGGVGTEVAGWVSNAPCGLMARLS